MSDLAGIYTCSTPDSQIRFNVVHNVSRRDYGGWGIYLDEGGHDILVEKNLVYCCQNGGFFAHHNRNVTANNNIFALNPAAQIERGGIGGFELNCRRNIIYFGSGKAVGSYGSQHTGRDVCKFDDNLYWNTAEEPVMFGDLNLTGWRRLGQDQGSLQEDPLFEAPNKGDFRLRPGSPASKIRFEPWDLSQVGVRGKRDVDQ
jgi:hypothetical protein